MSGDSAASTLVEIKIKQLEREGKKLSEAEKKELYESIRATYEHQTDSALRRRAPLGRRHHRSGKNPRSRPARVRVRVPQSPDRALPPRRSPDLKHCFNFVGAPF